MLTNIGLILIAITWLYAAMSVSRRHPNMTQSFVWLYVLGVLLIAIESFQSGVIGTGLALNVVALFGAFVVGMKLRRG
ncbi:MAG: hypothetical protein NTY66_00695 [Candidatus Vogelbacteria bacterium]|nr:hypothetical protein [Candidatus Vogelbacteria bacterium]